MIEEIDGAIYALDSTTIDLCLSIFRWAKFRKTKAGIKMHTLLDLKGSIPTFIEITNALSHDVNILDILITEPGAYYIMDRAYVDFKRLYKINKNLGYFIIRAKKNFSFQRIYSSKVDKSTGLRCDQIIKLTGTTTKYDYPEKLRRVKYYDQKTEKVFAFLTNNFEIESLTVAELYKNRWQVKLFFKWIKQHLRIQSFYGTTTNAVKTQIWIAISIYVLISIIKKSLNTNLKLYTILQILSVSLFEKVPILQLLTDSDYKSSDYNDPNQLFLFDL